VSGLFVQVAALVMQEGKTKKVLAEINMGSSVYSTPVPANGTLYISNRNQLFALAEGAKGAPSGPATTQGPKTGTP